MQEIATRALSARQILFVIDGWDECKDPMLETRTRDALQCGRAVVLSRPHVRMFSHSADQEFTLACLDEKRLELFVDRWFGPDREDGASFVERVLSSYSHRLLMDRPLFAALLCWLWADRTRLVQLRREAGMAPTDELPDRPAELIRLFLSVFLSRRDRNEELIPEPVDVWQRVIPHLARRAGSEFTGERWTISLKGRPGSNVPLVRHLQEGRGLVVYDPADNSYSIVHQYFAEWMTAFHLCHFHPVTGMRDADELRRRTWSPAWTTTLCLYAEMAPAPQVVQLLDTLADDAGLNAKAPPQSIHPEALVILCAIFGSAADQHPERVLELASRLLQVDMDEDAWSFVTLLLFEHAPALALRMVR